MDEAAGTRGRVCRCGGGHGNDGVVSAVDVVAGWLRGAAAMDKAVGTAEGLLPWLWPQG